MNKRRNSRRSAQGERLNSMCPKLQLPTSTRAGSSSKSVRLFCNIALQAGSSGQGVRIRLTFDLAKRSPAARRNSLHRTARSNDRRRNEETNGSITWPFHVVTFYWAARVCSPPQHFHF